jgi:hypothetical protein
MVLLIQYMNIYPETIPRVNNIRVGVRYAATGFNGVPAVDVQSPEGILAAPGRIFHPTIPSRLKKNTKKHLPMQHPGGKKDRHLAKFRTI